MIIKKLFQHHQTSIYSLIPLIYIPCLRGIQDAETYNKNIKKETLVRFFIVNSKKNIPQVPPIYIPHPRVIQDAENYKKKSKKETLVRFFKVNFKKNLPHTHTRIHLQKKKQ